MRDIAMETVGGREIASRPAPDCIICGIPGDVQHEMLVDRLYHVPGMWSFRRCTKCRLGWADPKPLPSDIGRLYANYFTHSESIADAQRSAPRKRFIKRVVGVLFPWRRRALESDCRYLDGHSPGALLDVGCGSGGFLAGMAKLGWACTGVEFDPDAVKAASEHGFEVHTGSLEQQAFPDASFDAITLSNVIEHLPDPETTFAELSRILKPGGLLAIITPNVNSLGHKAFGRCWRGLEPPRHLYVFNRWALKALANRSGLGVQACFTTPGSSVLEASAELWGTRPGKPDIRRLRLREQLTTLFNSDDGEFVILLANRP